MVRAGLCPQWVAWMKVCVCGGSMYIVVNESPTEGINTQSGVKIRRSLICLKILSLVWRG